MEKGYRIFTNPEDSVYMVAEGDKVIAWFMDMEHAQEFKNIRTGTYYAVRSHELNRIRENVDRMIKRLED